VRGWDVWGSRGSSGLATLTAALVQDGSYGALGAPVIKAVGEVHRLEQGNVHLPKDALANIWIKGPVEKEAVQLIVSGETGTLGNHVSQRIVGRDLLQQSAPVLSTWRLPMEEWSAREISWR